MPHFSIEYSANLEPLADMRAVCEAVRRAAAETGVFPLGGIRVRAMRCDYAAIADGDPAHAFADLTLRMGEGRDLAARKRAGDHIFAALRQALQPAAQRTTLALSLNLYEINSALSWKQNAIHDALEERRLQPPKNLGEVAPTAADPGSRAGAGAAAPGRSA